MMGAGAPAGAQDFEIRPSLAELNKLGRGDKAITVSCELLADVDTPVSAYLKVRDDGPSFLLESVEGGERVGRYSFIGSSPRRVMQVKNGLLRFDNGEGVACRDPLEAVRSVVEQYSEAQLSDARFEGGALGYLSYEASRAFETIPAATRDPLGLPDAAFMDVDSLLIFDHVKRTIRIVSHVWPVGPVDAAYREAVERLDGLARKITGPLNAPAMPSIHLGEFVSNVGREAYGRMVRHTKDHILAGDILQAVISQRLSAALAGDPFSLYRRLRTVSPSPYMYYLDFVDHQLVGASPELLVQVEGDVVTARPIAGTRRRGATPQEDAALAAELLEDEKERAEHLMLVDLARNDVGRVSRPGSVRVTQFMAVERFSHVMHLVSNVVGSLRSECSAYDAVRAAFPAGTVSGAPKIRAMQIIAELEPDQRGPYAGAVGFMSPGGSTEMAITIRTGVVRDGAVHVQVGAGIVADSVPEQELAETMNKARAFLQATGSQG